MRNYLALVISKSECTCVHKYGIERIGEDKKRHSKKFPGFRVKNLSSVRTSSLSISYSSFIITPPSSFLIYHLLLLPHHCIPYLLSAITSSSSCSSLSAMTSSSSVIISLRSLSCYYGKCACVPLVFICLSCQNYVN